MVNEIKCFGQWNGRADVYKGPMCCKIGLSTVVALSLCYYIRFWSLRIWVIIVASNRELFQESKDRKYPAANLNRKNGWVATVHFPLTISSLSLGHPSS